MNIHPTPAVAPVTATGALRARNLHKSYGDAARHGTIALSGIDLDIDQGSSVAIMGTSGSGKTTLLHVLAGILLPDTGNVVYQPGYGAAPLAIESLSERERSRLRRESFGFVFQQGLLIDELTAVENVALALMLGGTAKDTAQAHAARWLAALGLAGLEERRIGELSGGQAQRVAIARAQVTGAGVIFADEPTGALDSATSAEVMDALLQSTVGGGKTLVVVTHDPTVASRCGRVVQLRDGRIVSDSAGEVASSAAVPAMHPGAGR